MKSIRLPVGPKRRSAPILSFVRFLIICLWLTVLGLVQAAPKPVRVFILAGQSNMQGQGMVSSLAEMKVEKPGTLASMLKDPAKAPLLKHWVNAKGEWVEEREDVWVWDVNEFGSRHGRLEFGYGWNLGSRMWFGPEMQFGHLLGNHFDNQVLIIKTAWGGRDLYKDFRPPSSGGTVGPFYTQMVATVSMVLGDLKQQFSDYEGGGYELSGLVWWHGWNDFCSPEIGAPGYETNLVNLINDLRLDLKIPRLPVVIGEFTGPWGADCKEPAAVTIRNAQQAVAARPEFGGTVKFVATHDFVRAEQDSPTEEGYHEFKNGETYFLIGDALGKGMLELLSQTTYQTNAIEGWKVLVNEQLRREEKPATEQALELLRGQLREIVRVVPASAVARLREVTLWFSPEYPGVPPRAEYHPGAGWLRDNGRDPAMVQGVEFTNVRNFAAETGRMPNFTLHELAHAYHDRVLARGFEIAEIMVAGARAQASKSYDQVARWSGPSRPITQEKAYAMTDPMEYFAESTEAFFSRNDFFPFTRDELKQHDPEMEKLLIQLWGVTK